jgi:hypothetical protein
LLLSVNHSQISTTIRNHDVTFQCADAPTIQGEKSIIFLRSFESFQLSTWLRVDLFEWRIWKCNEFKVMTNDNEISEMSCFVLVSLSNYSTETILRLGVSR